MRRSARLHYVVQFGYYDGVNSEREAASISLAAPGAFH